MVTQERLQVNLSAFQYDRLWIKSSRHGSPHSLSPRRTTDLSHRDKSCATLLFASHAYFFGYPTVWTRVIL